MLSIDAKNNAVIIGDNNELFKEEIYINDINFLSGKAPSNEFECEVKIRCAAKPAKATLTISENRGKIIFQEPQRAAAPGQTAAIYIDDILIGGGTICNP